MNAPEPTAQQRPQAKQNDAAYSSGGAQTSAPLSVGRANGETALSHGSPYPTENWIVTVRGVTFDCTISLYGDDEFDFEFICVAGDGADLMWFMSESASDELHIAVANARANAGPEFCSEDDL